MSGSRLEPRPGRVCFTFSDGRRTSATLDALAGPASALDVDALAARSLFLPPTTASETPYAGIVCTLQEPPPVPAKRGPSTAADAARVLRRALEQAIERALGDARSVAVMTGGGLDSAGLLALALQWARPRGATVFAVAIDFAARGDDRPYLRLLEQSLGCEVVRVTPEECSTHLRFLDGVDGAPFAWPTAPMEVETMARARARGADCVLNGIGGDDIFDGHPRALADVARRGELRRAVRAARALRGFGRPRSRVLSWVLRPLVASVTPTAVRLHLARRRPPFVPAWAGPTLRRYLERMHARHLRSLERLLPQGSFTDPEDVERSRIDVAWLRHQAEIASGIERRDPYLDRELIATVAGFEPSFLLEGGIRRGLFRAALADLLPARLLEREDKARFETAIMRVTGAPEGLERMRDLASCDELASLGLVEPRPFREAFDALVAAPDEVMPWVTTWAALGVEHFLRARRARLREQA